MTTPCLNKSPPSCYKSKWSLSCGQLTRYCHHFEATCLNPGVVTISFNFNIIWKNPTNHEQHEIMLNTNLCCLENSHSIPSLYLLFLCRISFCLLCCKQHHVFLDKIVFRYTKIHERRGCRVSGKILTIQTCQTSSGFAPGYCSPTTGNVLVVLELCVKSLQWLKALSSTEYSSINYFF